MVVLDIIKNVLGAVSDTSFEITTHVLSSESMLFSAAALGVIGFAQPYLCGVLATQFLEQHGSKFRNPVQGIYDELMMKLDSDYLPRPTNY